MFIDHFDRHRPDLIHNMSCQPRTTVYSDGLDPGWLPNTLKKRQILVDPENYLLPPLKKYVTRKPDMTVPMLVSLLNLGPRQYVYKYIEHVENNPGHERQLLDWMIKTPEEAVQLPRVGLVSQANKRNLDAANNKNFKKIKKASTLHLALFLMARSNKYIYMCNKSPLLSQISIQRRLLITF